LGEKIGKTTRPTFHALSSSGPPFLIATTLEINNHNNKKKKAFLESNNSIEIAKSSFYFISPLNRKYK